MVILEGGWKAYDTQWIMDNDAEFLPASLYSQCCTQLKSTSCTVCDKLQKLERKVKIHHTFSPMHIWLIHFSNTLGEVFVSDTERDIKVLYLEVACMWKADWIHPLIFGGAQRDICQGEMSCKTPRPRVPLRAEESVFFCICVCGEEAFVKCPLTSVNSHRELPLCFMWDSTIFSLCL